MAKIKLNNSLIKDFAETLKFLEAYPANLTFNLYTTLTGNRVSLEVLFTPEQEFKEVQKQCAQVTLTGYELKLGTIHLILAYKPKDITNLKQKVEKLVKQASIVETVSRKYGYPYDGLWGCSWLDSQKYTENKAKYTTELNEAIKAKIQQP